MGAYETPGGQIDKSREAANIAMGQQISNQQKIFDSLTKSFRDRKKQMKVLVEKNQKAYAKNYQKQASGVPESEYNHLNNEIDNLLRDGGTLYEGSQVNQTLNPDNEHYMSYREGSKLRGDLENLPTKISDMNNFFTVWGDKYRKAKLIPPGKPGSVLTDGSQKSDHVILLDNLTRDGGSNITTNFNRKNGELLINYDDGENKFSMTHAELKRIGVDGDDFFSTTGDLGALTNTVVETLKKDVLYNEPVKLKKDGKYKNVQSVLYDEEGGANDRLTKAVDNYQFEGIMNGSKMTGVWEQLKNEVKGMEAITVGGVEYTGEAAYEKFVGKDGDAPWIGGGQNMLLDDNEEMSSQAKEQRAFAKAALGAYVLGEDNGYIKHDRVTNITEKYVSGGSGSGSGSGLTQELFDNKKEFIKNKVKTGKDLVDLLSRSSDAGQFTIKEVKDETGEKIKIPFGDKELEADATRKELLVDNEPTGIFADEEGNWLGNENVATIIDRYLSDDFFEAMPKESKVVSESNGNIDMDAAKEYAKSYPGMTITEEEIQLGLLMDISDGSKAGLKVFIDRKAALEKGDNPEYESYDEWLEEARKKRDSDNKTNKSEVL